MTYNNKTQSVARHVVGLCNDTAIMDQDQSSSKALGRAKPYLNYADLRGRKSITTGLAVTDYNKFM